MNRPKAILFDCDGVLVDSRRANIATYQRLFQAVGEKPPDEDEILGCIHLDFTSAIARLQGGYAPDEAKANAFKNALSTPGIRATELLEYDDRLIPLLGRVGAAHSLGLVTNRSRLGINDIFSVVPMRDFFQTVITADDVSRPKPAPDALLQASRDLRVPLEECIYLGDCITDTMAARNANMRSLHITKECFGCSGAGHLESVIDLEEYLRSNVGAD